MATLADLRIDLGNLLADTTNDRWDATAKNLAINEGYRRLAARVRIPSLKLTWTLAGVGGTASYPFSAAVPLTSPIKLIQQVYWGNRIPENKLVPLDDKQFDELDQTITSDKPTHYIIRNRTLILYPIPTTSATINLEGWTGITALSADGETPLLPTDFHHYIPFYAAWKLLLMDKNPEDIPLAREYKNEFKDGVEELIAFHEEIGMEDDRPDQVFDTYDAETDFYGSL